MVKQRQIIVHSDYANGDTEGPYRDGRVDDTLVSPNTVRVYDGVLADGYLELSHDGVQAKVESSLGVVEVDGVVVVAHERRHLVEGEDPIYVGATRAPTTSDDGYGVGKRWLNLLTDGYEYVCIQDSPGNAIWRTSTGGSIGISEFEHERLDTLTHWLAEDAYEEIIRDPSPCKPGHLAPVTSIVVWSSPAKTLKIRETLLIRTGNRITSMVETQYDSVGAVKYTLTSTVSRTGNKISSITYARV